MWRLHVPVGIDHAGGLLEDRLDLCGHLHPTGSVGSVHLGDQRLQHRRSWRHLRHLQRRAERPRDRQQPIADTARHVVALLGSLPLGHQVHLQVRKVRGPAEKVVTHQSVEVVWRGCPDVLLDIHHGLILQRGRAQGRRDARRRFERGALRHVDHHLEFALVVEREHLDGDQPKGHEGHRDQQQHRHAHQKEHAHATAREERTHHASIHAREQILLAVLVVSGRFQEPHRRPWRHDEGDDEREDHRRRRADRNRPHVRAHQAANEGHRQNGGNHRQCGQDRRIAHFVHRPQRHGHQPARLAGGQPRMPHDVLHHHDRVVHQDADGEDQGEERDAVERVAVEIEHEQRQREGHGDGDEDHGGFAPTEHQPDQRRHRQHRQQHVPQELVALLGRRLAVVARDRQVHVRRAPACPSTCRASV